MRDPETTQLFYPHGDMALELVVPDNASSILCQLKRSEFELRECEMAARLHSPFSLLPFNIVEKQKVYGSLAASQR